MLKNRRSTLFHEGGTVIFIYSQAFFQVSTSARPPPRRFFHISPLFFLCGIIHPPTADYFHIVRFLRPRYYFSFRLKPFHFEILMSDSCCLPAADAHTAATTPLRPDIFIISLRHAASWRRAFIFRPSSPSSLISSAAERCFRQTPLSFSQLMPLSMPPTSPHPSRSIAPRPRLFFHDMENTLIFAFRLRWLSFCWRYAAVICYAGSFDIACRPPPPATRDFTPSLRQR